MITKFWSLPRNIILLICVLLSKYVGTYYNKIETVVIPVVGVISVEQREIEGPQISAFSFIVGGVV